MRIRLMIGALIASVGVTACGSAAPSSGAVGPPAAEASSNVTIKNFAFTPDTLRIPTGTTVTWMNADSTVHTTTAAKPEAVTWDSGLMRQNSFYAVVFTKPGTYSFHCSIHEYMTGTITVTG